MHSLPKVPEAAKALNVMTSIWSWIYQRLPLSRTAWAGKNVWGTKGAQRRDENRAEMWEALCLLVGAEGFEPPTLCSQSRCATRLRYAPTSIPFPQIRGSSQPLRSTAFLDGKAASSLSQEPNPLWQRS
jgi:hypothetical protein